MSKKMRFQIILAVMLCFVTATHATEKFTIEDYVPLKFSDLIWKLDGSTGGSRQNYSYNNDESDKSLSKYFNVSLQSNVDYFYETLSKSFTSSIYLRSRYRNSSRESTDKTELIFSPYLDSIENQNSNNKSGNINLTTQTEFTNYDIRNNFYSLTFNSSAEYMNRFQNDYEYENFGFYNYLDSVKITQDRYFTDNSEHSIQFKVGAEFTIGNGRQYVGQYAFITYNILEELKKNGLLQNYPDKQTMIALTDIIYQIENRHTIDRRLKEIEKYDSVFQFLMKNKIVTENNHHLGLLFVQDAFAIFPREYRRFGFSKSVGLGISYGYSNSHFSQFSSQTNNTYTYITSTPEIIDTVLTEQTITDTYKRYSGDELLKYVVANLAYGKPVSMKWQLDATASAKYYFDTDEFYYSYNRHPYNSIAVDKKYNVYLTAKSTYYYNSRTLWKIYGRYSLDRFNNTGALSTKGRDYNDRMMNLGSSVEYRLNIPTIISAIIEYTRYAYNSSDNDGINFSLSLSHYIY